ncbi:prevent-host-death protein [Flavobacterium sp. IR1]|nr:prevent-host-death protein [Flavobacterium sp. IR1]
MVEITSREFRDNQREYFDLADNGTQIIIKKGKKKAYILTPISENDLSFTPEMIERINLSIEQEKKGEITRIATKEELKNLLVL